MPKHFQIASCEVEEKVTKTLWFPVLTITGLESRQTGLRIYGKGLNMIVFYLTIA